MPGDEVASAKSKRVSPKAVGVVIAAVVIVAAVAVGVWQAIAWEATPQPTSSVGTSGALRGWLALIAISLTAIATAFLAWFARRVPEGVSGLMDRLDFAEAARQDAEEARHSALTERDAIAARLALPYLFGQSVPQGAAHEGAEARVDDTILTSFIAPFLRIRLPHGDLPQEVHLDKEECRKLHTEIERAEREAGKFAQVGFANVVLVATVNDPHDNSSEGYLALYPQTSGYGPEIASGMLHDWPRFREAVRQVATHRLPSITEYQQRTTDEQ